MKKNHHMTIIRNSFYSSACVSTGHWAASISAAVCLQTRRDVVKIVISSYCSTVFKQYERNLCQSDRTMTEQTRKLILIMLFLPEVTLFAPSLNHLCFISSSLCEIISHYLLCCCFVSLAPGLVYSKCQLLSYDARMWWLLHTVVAHSQSPCCIACMLITVGSLHLLLCKISSTSLCLLFTQDHLGPAAPTQSWSCSAFRPKAPDLWLYSQTLFKVMRMMTLIKCPMNVWTRFVFCIKQPLFLNLLTPSVK